jgi:hypothetical protein
MDDPGGPVIGSRVPGPAYRAAGAYHHGRASWPALTGMLYRLRWLLTGLACLVIATGAGVIWRYRVDLFGPGTWGTGGNMVAWIICGLIGGAWLRSKERAQHLARMLQAERHHEEIMVQGQVHHEDMKAHVTAETSTSGGTGGTAGRDHDDHGDRPV